MEYIKRNALGLISDCAMTQMKSARKRKKKKKKKCDSQEMDKNQNNAGHIQQETDTSQTDSLYQEKQPDENLTAKQQQPDQSQKLGQSVNSQPVFSTKTVNVVNSPQQKDKGPMMKAVTTKTFSKGLMDISLLTSNATQLREVILTPEHPFCDFVFWLILTSIVIQVLSTMLMLLSDYLKSSGVAKDNLVRKRLSFFTMALISLVTVLNVLISVFHIPGDFRHSSSRSTTLQ